MGSGEVCIMDKRKKYPESSGRFQSREKKSRLDMDGVICERKENSGKE